MNAYDGRVWSDFEILSRYRQLSEEGKRLACIGIHVAEKSEERDQATAADTSIIKFARRLGG